MKIILSSITVFILTISIALSQNVSNALEFDNIDDYVSIPNGTALFNGLSEFSMCGWVYPTNPNTGWPDYEGYFGIKNEGICDFYIVQLNGLGLEARITTNNGQFTINPGDLSEVVMDEWNHYALVYTGSELQVYLNGDFDGSVPANGTINYDNLELTLGKLVFGGQDFFLQGKLDEITIWDKALTDLEIQEYMCIGGDPASVPNLTAYYDFNEEEGLILPDYFGGYDGNLTGMTGEEWIISEVCESGSDATFTVVDSDSGFPVENASINVEGLVKTTNENGIAIFTNYDPGTYAFSVTKTNYYDYNSTFEILDEDIVVDVSFDPILTYSIAFSVLDNESNAVENAIVNLDGIIQYTNASGETVFEDYLPGSYAYSVIVEGFEFVTGSAEVFDEDLIIEINLVINQISENGLNNIQIYPNPTSGIVNFEFDESVNLPVDLFVKDLSGRTIKKIEVDNGQNQIDLTELDNGMYILHLKSNKATINKIFVHK